MKKPVAMTKHTKIALGVVSFCPIVYLILLVVLYFFVRPYLHAAAVGSQSANEFVWNKLILRLILPHMLALMCISGLLPYYIYHMVKIVRARTKAKVVWISLLFIGHVLVLPIYWYLFLWREPKSPVLQPE